MTVNCGYLTMIETEPVSVYTYDCNYESGTESIAFKTEDLVSMIKDISNQIGIKKFNEILEEL